MTMQYSSHVDVDNLFATSVIQVKTSTLSIAAHQTLKRGSLLTASGTLVSSTTTVSGDAAVTTYDDVYAVLADDVTTTNTAVTAAVYLTGEFNEKALKVATDNTVANFKESARKVGIFIEPCM